MNEQWHKSSASNPNGACLEAAYQKSSYSGGVGECAEVAYRKSTASSANGACAEVGAAGRSRINPTPPIETGADGKSVYVRDTKQAHLGDGRTVLEFSPSAWQAFTGGLKGARPDG